MKVLACKRIVGVTRDSALMLYGADTSVKLFDTRRQHR